MKVSFDGMRRISTKNVNKLFDILDIAIDELNDNDLKEQIIIAFNDVAHSVANFNLLFDPECKDDMNDLSDELAIELLVDLDERG